MDRPLLVVDAANVVGMVPDGWWRRRAEATELLRDAFEPLADTGLAGRDLPAELAWLASPALEVVLVVEGAAAGIGGSPSVRVVPARGSGDDAIVNLVAEEGGGRRTAVAKPPITITIGGDDVDVNVMTYTLSTAFPPPSRDP